MVYVDDIVLTGNASSFISLVIDFHHSQFDIEATWTTDSLFHNKTKYVIDLLEKENMVNNEPLGTHIDCSSTPP